MLETFKRKMVALAFALAFGAVLPSQVRGAAGTPSFLETLSSHESRVQSSPYAVGGDIIFKYPRGSGDFVYAHIFTNTSQSASFVPKFEMPVRMLLVGGGGSGGNSGYSDGGGGGGGGAAMDLRSVKLAADTYTVLVGAGAPGSGGAGYSGGSSSFQGRFSYEVYDGVITAFGGGGGGYSAGVKMVDDAPADNSGSPPKAGGTGGGHGSNWNFGDSYNQYAPIIFPGGKGVAGQGYDGGAMVFARQGLSASGGGGGAGGPGGDARMLEEFAPNQWRYLAPEDATFEKLRGSIHVDGGAGGIGLLSNILGFNQYFGGGGGGGTSASWSSGGAGGAGGGTGGFGREARGAAGTNGLGGGSGGGNANSIGGGPGSGNGGDGIVVIAYNESDMALARPEPKVVEYNGAAQDLVFDRKGAFTYEIQAGERPDGEPVWQPTENAFRTDAAEYVFRVSLKSGSYWGTDPEDTVPSVVTCRIDKAANPITNLRIRDWAMGHSPDAPACDVAFGADTVFYDYSSSYSQWPEKVFDEKTREYGKPGDWSDPPTTSGVWYVRALIPEAANWRQSSAIFEFTVARNEQELFNAHVDFAVTSGADETVADFPALIRLSEETCVGFRYSQLAFPRTGEDIRFFFKDAEDAWQPVPHEIDIWDPEGDSLIWVLVPEVPAAGATVRMYWNASGKLAANVPADVWKNFVGVWHMNLGADGKVKDSTGHGLDAMPDANLEVTNVAEGVIGGAVHGVRNLNDKTGNFVVPNWEPGFDVGSTFYFSGLVRFVPNSNGNFPETRFFCKKGSSSGQRGGWYFKLDGTNMIFYGHAQSSNKYDVAKDALASWRTLAVEATSAGVRTFDNGVQKLTLADALESSTNEFWMMRANQVVDEVRLSKVVPSGEWREAEKRQNDDPGSLCEPGDVILGGVTQNRWISLPTISKSRWDENDDPSEWGVATKGEAKYGDAVLTWRLAGSAEEHSLADEGMPVGSGVYELVCRVPEAEGISGLVATVPFRITGTQPQPRLDGDDEDASSHGRILLMNRDVNPVAPVDNQGYFDTNSMFSTFWENLTPDERLNDRTYNLQNGTEFMLWTRAYGRRLWYLKDCRQGNLFPYRNDDPLAVTNHPTMNFLPYSQTSKRITAHNDLPIRQRDVGQLLLRNVKDAAVMSPCYEDGIGTIYFDAVNGWLVDVPLAGVNDRQLSPDESSGYSVVVEIATNCVTVDGYVYNSPPVDERVDLEVPQYEVKVDPATGLIVSNRVGSTFVYGALANWQPVEVTAQLIRGGEVIESEEGEPLPRAFVTKELSLSVWTNDTVRFAEDESRTIFYRVHAKVNCYTPARFRIRRVKTYEGADRQTDGKGIIALDNVIASFPVMRADLSNYGKYDPDRGGKQIAGMEGAWMKPFPSATDRAIMARAKPVYSYGVGVTNANPANFVLSAQLNYRWRYLDQIIDPAEPKPWKKVELDIETFEALEPLDLGRRGQGDVEYYFTLVQETPYYKYVDYSGCADSSGAPLGVPGYTEELTAVTNHAAGLRFQNCGEDWFVRLRDGESNLEGIRLVTQYDVYDKWTGLLDWTVTETNEMEVVGDGLWRGFFRQPQQVDLDIQRLGEEVRYRFEAYNAQKPGSTQWETNVVYWSATGDAMELPYSDSLAEAEDRWSKVSSDRGAGYISFEIEEETRSVTVLHAEYQNFNSWGDANRGNRKFVGWSTTGDGMAGSSDATRSDAQNFETWKSMSESNDHWEEHFDKPTTVTEGEFVTFGETLTWNSWLAGEAMYVNGWFRHRDREVKSSLDANDYALQLKSGKGYVQFDDAAETARGVRDISFKARCGQTLDFNDIAYYDAGQKSKMRDYTFFTTVAFDENKGQDYQGDASVSVVAYYQPGVGCYELRIQQYQKGTVKDNDGTTDLTVPAQNSNIMSLYRWRDTGTGRVNAECLGAVTNAVSKMPLFGLNVEVAKQTGGLYSVEKVPYGYLPIYISVSNTANEVWIRAGVRDCYTSGSQKINNKDYPTSWFLGLQPTNTLADARGTYTSLSYRDASAERIQGGTYGVLSGNCPAVFVKPTYIDRPVYTHVGYPYCHNVTQNTDKVTWTLTGTYYYNPQPNVWWLPDNAAQDRPTPGTVPKATIYVRDSGRLEDPDFNPRYVMFDGKAEERRSVLVTADWRDCEWVMMNGRNEAFGEVDDPNDPYWGIRAVTPTQTVCVLSAPYDKAEWKLLSEKEISGFRNVEFKYDDQTEAGKTLGLFTTDDYRVRFEAGKQVGDVRTDVVLDNLEFRQWRGDEWNDPHLGENIPGWGYAPFDTTDAADIPAAGAFTNFSFSSCWITDTVNGKKPGGIDILMSAKRTSPTGPACAIYSPLYDGWRGRGKGLGMFMFKYRNAQNNVNLLLQVATNLTWDSSWGDVESSVYPDGYDWTELDYADWVTVTNFDFRGLSQIERNQGVRSCYVGIHDVCGVMRLVMDPAIVEEMSDPNYKLTGEFGDIYITEVFCRDEPGIDQGCWWGWNLRTLGSEGDGFADAENRMYLPDRTDDLSQLGQSLALNDSISADIFLDDAETYGQHLPFLQTPRFADGVTPGALTFKARKYDTKNPQPAQVTLYGSRSGSEYMPWDWLASFSITNDTFETYTWQFPPQEGHRAYRLVVTGVAGVKDELVENRRPDGGYASPVRVLLDEVCLKESIRARVALRNVGAFRAVAPADLSGDTEVPNVPSEDEQPLCDESWGVQCEVYAASLPQDIDFATPGHEPKVRLHWFDGIKPWGYDRWCTNKNANAAWLKPASDNPLVFRSSFATCPDAIMKAYSRPGSVVQYQLEVVYWEKEGGPYTNYMGAGEWKLPDWYHPLNFNRDYGENKHFAAYTILDTVAPHWAWINEVNIFSALDRNDENTERRQFVEIAVPAEAHIDDWQLILYGKTSSRKAPYIATNVIATFGYDVPAEKEDLIGMASGMVFRVVACPSAQYAGLSRKEGEFDGLWQFETTKGPFYRDNSISFYEGIGIALVRGSGIIEQEIVVIGTNVMEGTIAAKDYDPQDVADHLNKFMRDARFLTFGSDDGGTNATRGVFRNRGETVLDWNRDMELTPGRINQWQQIPSQHPTANTTTFFVYANLDPVLGHLSQRFGASAEFSSQNLLLVLPKGCKDGTNIVYRADKWFRLASVTTNDVAAGWRDLGDRTYEITVGKGASNNVVVVAAADVNDSLREMGVTEDNPYRDAIIDWVSKGQTLNGPFADPDCEEASLAEFWPISADAERSKMSLTDMYWLDMDPTIGSNLVFKAGVYDAKAVPVSEGVTNRRITVMMMISNTVDDIAWAPYTLRGLAPGETSENYDPYGTVWTSVTFKVTGFINTDLTSTTNAEDWVPLRWFVFGLGPDGKSTSFRPQGVPGEFTADIDVDDPFGQASPGYWTAWGQWIEEHCRKRGEPLPQMFFSWAIDNRGKPIGVEQLEPDSTFGEKGK